MGKNLRTLRLGHFFNVLIKKFECIADLLEINDPWTKTVKESIFKEIIKKEILKNVSILKKDSTQYLNDEF